MCRKPNHIYYKHVVSVGIIYVAVYNNVCMYAWVWTLSAHIVWLNWCKNQIERERCKDGPKIYNFIAVCCWPIVVKFGRSSNKKHSNHPGRSNNHTSTHFSRLYLRAKTGRRRPKCLSNDMLYGLRHPTILSTAFLAKYFSPHCTLLQQEITFAAYLTVCLCQISARN